MKLVRSKLVGKRENRHYHQVGGDRFTTLLIHKAYEELHEVAEQMLLNEGNDLALIEELGDLMEVMRTIADWFEIDMEEVGRARLKKHEQKGGFTERWVIV